MGSGICKLVILFAALLPSALSQRARPLQVDVASHTHLDAGWLYPMEELYLGRVRYIVTTLVQNLLLSKLQRDPLLQRKFNW